MDTYKTISQPSEEVIFKDKSSKFLGYAFPVTTEDEIKDLLEEVKKQHHSARHWCYAWQLGAEKPHYRANDDGEPSNTAGMPIYGQIQSFEVTNVLIIVVRYFGGIKLGVGGLINAYRTTAQMALEASDIVEKIITITFIIRFEYKNMNRVMRVIKAYDLNVCNQILALDCQLFVEVRKDDAEKIRELFENMYEIEIREEDEESEQ